MRVRVRVKVKVGVNVRVRERVRVRVRVAASSSARLEVFDEALAQLRRLHGLPAIFLPGAALPPDEVLLAACMV